MMSQLTSSGAASTTVDDVMDIMRTDLVNGLTTEEADRRLLIHGPNKFDIVTGDPIWMKYICQFNDPLIMLLLVSASVSVLLEQFDDALSIVLAIVTVVTVAFVQEYRSEKFLEALTNLVPPECCCLRDGHLMKFLAECLVPGDIVYISIGDRVPADIRLFEAVSLGIDESSFTGETEPVKKTRELQTPKQVTNINGCRNIAFMGSLVCTGHGKGIVVSTGHDSEFGEIFKLMQSEEAPKTPLQKSMDVLGQQLSFYSFLVITIIVFVGWMQGRKILDMFTIGVSLAVAAIPEGLPIVVTVTLAIGVMRMAKRNAIVKKLPAVETLGCVDVICCDKTGTLTKNEMTVTHIITSDHHRAELTGVGYYSPGLVNIVHTDSLHDPEDSIRAFKKVIEVGCVCNNAEISGDTLLGSPTEKALIGAVQKFNLPDMRQMYVRIDEWPFSSNTKTMMVKCHLEIDEKHVVYFFKGAIEIVLEKCTLLSSNGKTLPLLDTDKETYLGDAHLLSLTGLRVLGMACGSDMESLVYVGLVGIIDPPRDGVSSTIESLHGMNIKVKMLTGDSEDTAKAVGARIGLYAEGVHTFSGAELEALDLSELSVAIENALQASKHVVAMTGDGINDAVALKSADIGISMGKTGTDVAKEAADMILVDDDLNTILAAIEEGKSIFFNIKNFVRFQLSTSMSALSLVAIAMFLKLPNPLNAMQILWINIIMDGPPAQSLGVEPVDHDVLKQPPRNVTDYIITRPLIIGTLVSATIIVSGTMLIFHEEMKDGQLTRRDTTMTFTCFVFFDMFNALGCRSMHKSIFHVGFTTNRTFLYSVAGSVIGQLLVIYFPPLQTVFQTEALYVSDLCLLVLLTSSVFFISELRKFIIRLLEYRAIQSRQNIYYPENMCLGAS